VEQWTVVTGDFGREKGVPFGKLRAGFRLRFAKSREPSLRMTEAAGSGRMTAESEKTKVPSTEPQIPRLWWPKTGHLRSGGQGEEARSERLMADS
jgi:hypothetical protein